MSNVINNNGATKKIIFIATKKNLTQFRAVLAHFIFSISHETRLHIKLASEQATEWANSINAATIARFFLLA